MQSTRYPLLASLLALTGSVGAVVSIPPAQAVTPDPHRNMPNPRNTVPSIRGRVMPWEAARFRQPVPEGRMTRQRRRHAEQKARRQERP